MVISRLQAYAQLTHHALDTLYQQDRGCCTKCCAACDALAVLDNEGILDEIVKNWEEYSDGTKVLANGREPAWWKDGKVDREWLYGQWANADKLQCHT